MQSYRVTLCPRQRDAYADFSSITAMAISKASAMLMAADMTRAVPMIGATATRTFCASSIVIPASAAGPASYLLHIGPASTAARAASRTNKRASGASSHSATDTAVMAAIVSSTGVSWDSSGMVELLCIRGIRVGRGSPASGAT